MRYMESETTNPAKIMSSHTLNENGERKENKFTDLAGAFTYKRLMPEKEDEIQIVQSTLRPRMGKGVSCSASIDRVLVNLLKNSLERDILLSQGNPRRILNLALN